MVARLFKTIALLSIFIFGASGCIPEFLQKYRKESGSKDGVEAGAHEGPGADMPVGSVTESKGRSSGSRKGSDAPQRATIYALDRQTYRFHIKEEDVWNVALDVLMKNYNVNIVERQSGIITTEWDSYYLSSAVYRNKVSMRFRRQTSGVVDLTIVNNVERLRDASTAGSGVGAVWLPGSDAANEVSRIVQNMALALKQPPPVLPAGATAVQANSLDQPGTPISDYVEKPR